jgi:lysozyme family protein
MDFTEAFVDAFNHAMIYECGPFWDPTDPDVIAGNCSTREQRRKVGYVNIPTDRGGETKYGIAQNSNPNVNVRNLDLNGAMEVYFQNYWFRGKCDKLSPPVSSIHFDGCVNHGIGRANKFLQRALGVADDGVVGSGTLAAASAADALEVVQSIAKQREDFYRAIVNRDATQGVFLNGWLRRINEVRDFALTETPNTQA